MSLQILLHSSKTMRVPAASHVPIGVPVLLHAGVELASIWKNASPQAIRTRMKISDSKVREVQELYAAWSADGALQSPAADTFKGDIYSGLQVQTWSDADRSYAHKHLLILSGLYGGLRAFDGVMPYRLEMGYKLPDGRSLYNFWSDKIATLLPNDTTTVINLSAVEYTKAILPYVQTPIITPKFLTVSAKTGEPIFVTVHAKIARGAFASWLVKNRIQDMTKLPDFTDLGYRYDASLSTMSQPAFVCQEFGGLGMSVRLQK